MTNLRQASAEHFQQRAELLPLRNRGLRAQLPSMTRNVVDMIGSKFNFALGGMRLYQRNLVNGSVSLPVEMWALSPSQYENLIAKQNLGALIVSQTRPEARIPDRNPNHGSVASVVMVGNCHILLGADLEEPGDTRLGWSAVRSNPGRPNLHCSIFKIPHHGSITGSTATACLSASIAYAYGDRRPRSRQSCGPAAPTVVSIPIDGDVAGLDRMCSDGCAAMETVGSPARAAPCLARCAGQWHKHCFSSCSTRTDDLFRSRWVWAASMSSHLEPRR